MILELLITLASIAALPFMPVEIFLVQVAMAALLVLIFGHGRNRIPLIPRACHEIALDRFRLILAGLGIVAMVGALVLDWFIPGVLHPLGTVLSIMGALVLFLLYFLVFWNVNGCAWLAQQGAWMTARLGHGSRSDLELRYLAVLGSLDSGLAFLNLFYKRDGQRAQVNLRKETLLRYGFANHESSLEKTWKKTSSGKPLLLVLAILPLNCIIKFLLVITGILHA